MKGKTLQAGRHGISASWFPFEVGSAKFERAYPLESPAVPHVRSRAHCTAWNTPQWIVPEKTRKEKVEQLSAQPKSDRDFRCSSQPMTSLPSKFRHCRGLTGCVRMVTTFSPRTFHSSSVPPSQIGRAGLVFTGRDRVALAPQHVHTHGRAPLPPVSLFFFFAGSEVVDQALESPVYVVHHLDEIPHKTRLAFGFLEVRSDLQTTAPCMLRTAVTAWLCSAERSACVLLLQGFHIASSAPPACSPKSSSLATERQKPGRSSPAWQRRPFSIRTPFPWPSFLGLAPNSTIVRHPENPTIFPPFSFKERSKAVTLHGFFGPSVGGVGDKSLRWFLDCLDLWTDLGQRGPITILCFWIRERNLQSKQIFGRPCFGAVTTYSHVVKLPAHAVSCSGGDRPSPRNRARWDCCARLFSTSTEPFRMLV